MRSRSYSNWIVLNNLQNLQNNENLENLEYGTNECRA